jgi:N-formylglutamate amidohydrolase
MVVLLAAHSMPSVERTGVREGPPSGPRSRNGHSLAGGDGARRAEEPRPRADVVPGTRGRKSADARFIDAVEQHAAARGWTVRHDDPYAGGFTTQHYGRPAAGIHAVQVELARRLYLDESSLRPNDNFARARAWCRELVARLGKVALNAG